VQVLSKLCGTRCTQLSGESKKKSASAMAVVTYTRAVQRNLIKGLATYNILQNPTYKESFAITWKFAMNNKGVREVRLNKVGVFIFNVFAVVYCFKQCTNNLNFKNTLIGV
jgi:hypothetical protein